MALCTLIHTTIVRTHVHATTALSWSSGRRMKESTLFLLCVFSIRIALTCSRWVYLLSSCRRSFYVLVHRSSSVRHRLRSGYILSGR